MNNKILVYQKIIIVVYLTFCRLVACVFIFLLLGKRNLWWVFFFLNNKFSIFFAFWADRVRYETWGYVFIWTFNLFVLNILFPIWNDIFYPFMRILWSCVHFNCFCSMCAVNCCCCLVCRSQHCWVQPNKPPSQQQWCRWLVGQ